MFWAALGVMLAAAWAGGFRVRTTEDYFLAGRRLPWWLAALSITATEVSVMTVLGLSAEAFRGDWSYLRFFLGAAVGRVVVALILVPAAHRSGAVTVYGWLRERVGPRSGAACAALFFASRLLASAARVAAACAAARFLLGWSLGQSLALVAGLGALAVLWGGLRSAAWANVVQLAVVLAAGVLASLLILRRLDGGLDTALFVALRADKLRWLGGGALWPALGGGFFGALAAFGADHNMMQRALAAESPAKARWAMLASLFGSLLVLGVFLSLGTLLFVYYKQNPGLALPTSLDGIYLHFIATAMPASLRGAALAGVILASIDLPLPALSAVFIEDLWRPLVGPLSPSAGLWAARAAAAASALSLAALARVLVENPGALVLAVKLGTVAAGILLGAMAPALLPLRVRDRSAAAAAVVAAAACAVLLIFYAPVSGLPFSWSWLGPLGAAGAALLAFGFAPVLG